MSSPRRAGGRARSGVSSQAGRLAKFDTDERAEFGPRRAELLRDRADGGGGLDEALALDGPTVVLGPNVELLPADDLSAEDDRVVPDWSARRDFACSGMVVELLKAPEMLGDSLGLDVAAVAAVAPRCTSA